MNGLGTKLWCWSGDPFNFKRLDQIAFIVGSEVFPFSHFVFFVTSLQNNTIKDEGTIHLARALEHNQTLRSLRLVS